MTASRYGKNRALIALAALASFSASAQQFPVKPVRVVVGGGSDVIVRIIGQKLPELWHQQVVSDNRPGAGGAIAGDIVARAAPDGYTLLMAAPTFAINAALRLAPYDPLRDFTAVVMAVDVTPFILTINPSLPVRSVQELVALAKAKPGQLNFATSQVGGPTHLCAEMFKVMAGVNMVHVPYKGADQATVGLLTGEAPVYFAVAPSVLPLIRAGKLRALAVTTGQRSPLAPELPTIAESGVPGYEMSGWNGILAPAGTPMPVVTRINQNVLEAVKDADVIKRLTMAGYLPAPENTPVQFGDFVKKELDKYTKLVKDSGMQAR